MKKGLDLREHARDRQRWREAHPEEARLRDEKMTLFYEGEYQYMARRCEWPTKAEAGRMASLHRGTIGRAVDSREIETNGLRGRFMRIDPSSLRRYRRRVAARARAGRARRAAGRG